MLTVAPENDLLSLGKLCELLQASPNRIARAAELARVKPTFQLNGVAYFADPAVDAIREQLAKKSVAD
jgi:hypothetical protein